MTKSNLLLALGTAASLIALASCAGSGAEQRPSTDVKSTEKSCGEKCCGGACCGANKGEKSCGAAQGAPDGGAP